MVKIVENLFKRFLANHADGNMEIKGTVFLQKKNVFDLNDQFAYVADTVSELVGGKVDLQLVSVEIDPDSGVGKRSKIASLEGWLCKLDTLTADEGHFYSVTFKVDKDFGMPGAILVKNNHLSWFYLKYITLDMPDMAQIQFPCNSWVYNHRHYDGPRIFFSNKVYLPSQTPPGLVDLRYSELDQLRGDGKGERLRPDRVYDYDVYNDLGNPDKGQELYSRSILGGSEEYPYPRRCRTGRARTKTDHASERPVELAELVYIPRDERFEHTKKSDFLGSSIKSFAHAIMPAIEMMFERSTEFEGIHAIKELYSKGVDLISCTSNTLSAKEKGFLGF